MSDSNSVEEKLAVLDKGLLSMGRDCARALSSHETLDLIEALRGTVAELKAELNK